MWLTPATLRPDDSRLGTIRAPSGEDTMVKTTGMSVMCLAGSTSSNSPTVPSVTPVPQV